VQVITRFALRATVSLMLAMIFSTGVLLALFRSDIAHQIANDRVASQMNAVAQVMQGPLGREAHSANVDLARAKAVLQTEMMGKNGKGAPGMVSSSSSQQDVVAAQKTAARSHAELASAIQAAKDSSAISGTSRLSGLLELERSNVFVLAAHYGIGGAYAALLLAVLMLGRAAGGNAYERVRLLEERLAIVRTELRSRAGTALTLSPTATGPAQDELFAQFDSVVTDEIRRAQIQILEDMAELDDLARTGTFGHVRE
jgi:hypothetical protein